MQRGDLDRNSSNYLGKLRANFIGTEFVVYDSGANPKDRGLGGSSASRARGVRQELGGVQYASNVLGSRGPRKMKVEVERSRKK